MPTMAPKDFCNYVPRLHIADGQKPHLIGRPVWFDPPRRGVEQWGKKKKFPMKVWTVRVPCPQFTRTLPSLELSCCPAAHLVSLAHIVCLALSTCSLKHWVSTPHLSILPTSSFITIHAPSCPAILLGIPKSVFHFHVVLYTLTYANI